MVRVNTGLAVAEASSKTSDIADHSPTPSDGSGKYSAGIRRPRVSTGQARSSARSKQPISAAATTPPAVTPGGCKSSGSLTPTPSTVVAKAKRSSTGGRPATDTPLKGSTTVKVAPTSKRTKSKSGAASAAAAGPSSSSKRPVQHLNGRWNKQEDAKLRVAVAQMGGKNWKKISEIAFQGARTDVQCLHRWQKVLRPGLHKGPWSKAEDQIVIDMVAKCGGVENVKWSIVASKVAGRLGKQVRERWYNHLDPTLNKGPWLPEEDAKLAALQAELGNRWCEISKHLQGRSENAVKNRWNSAQRRARIAKKAQEKAQAKAQAKALDLANGGTKPKAARSKKAKKAKKAPRRATAKKKAPKKTQKKAQKKTTRGKKKRSRASGAADKSSKRRAKKQRRARATSPGSVVAPGLHIFADISTAIDMCGMREHSPCQTPTRPATPPTSSNAATSLKAAAILSSAFTVPGLGGASAAFPQTPGAVDPLQPAKSGPMPLHRKNSVEEIMDAAAALVMMV